MPIRIHLYTQMDLVEAKPAPSLTGAGSTAVARGPATQGRPPEEQPPAHHCIRVNDHDADGRRADNVTGPVAGISLRVSIGVSKVCPKWLSQVAGPRPCAVWSRT